MSRIRPGWVPPSLDTAVVEHCLGYDFTSDIAVTITGLWWWQPSHINRPSTVRAQMYDTAGQTLLADSGSVSAAGFALDAWTLITFSAAYAAAPGTTYTASVYSTGATAYDGDDLLADVVDPTGHVRSLAGKGRFRNGAGAAFPTSTWNGMHAVDVEFVSAGAASVAPDGLAVPVALGAPSVVWAGSVAPDGISVPVAVGGPIVGVAVTAGTMTPFARSVASATPTTRAVPRADPAHRAGPTMTGG